MKVKNCSILWELMAFRSLFPARLHKTNSHSSQSGEKHQEEEGDKVKVLQYIYLIMDNHVVFTSTYIFPWSFVYRFVSFLMLSIYLFFCCTKCFSGVVA